MTIIRAFWKSTGGATVVEYALIGGLISLVIVAAVTAIGTKLATNYYAPAVNGLQ